MITFDGPENKTCLPDFLEGYNGGHSITGAMAGPAMS